SQCVRNAAVIAYDDLGPEAMLRLEIVEFPLVVVNDIMGGDLYDDAIEKYRR
ncbi:MAG: fumarate hydratase C-terminal domain-containing protein, partial [Deltaproteobacteria bacterium]|nr:fumarate hydratase C-terminal domain-containing protein [Deltaproteobacteria bacterium]